MLPDYADILDAAGIAPLWFDQHGVPRFSRFHPDMQGIYDQYALYVLIRCQSCGRRIKVGEGWSKMRLLFPPLGIRPQEGEEARFLTFEEVASGYTYGDPPRHQCPGAGETMSCIDIRIMQAWCKENPLHEWERRPDIEAIKIHPDWDDEYDE